MLYDAHLSNILDQDIYRDGINYYIKYNTNYHCIGTTSVPVSVLRTNMESFIK